MNRFSASSAGLGIFLLTALLTSLPAAAQTHFLECGIGAGNINNATIVVPTSSSPDINGSPLATGSEIAVFKAGTDQCAGVEVWGGENMTITVWGDDDQTGEVEGLVAGDSMVFRVWDFASGMEFSGDAVASSYDANAGLNSSGLYANDGLYVLEDLSVEDESLQPPAAPTLISPENDAGNTSLTPALDWDPVDGALHYRVQVDDNAGFGSPEFDENQIEASTISTSTLEVETTYHWRVRATGDGGAGDWSSVRTFTTQPPPAPDAPDLLTPADGASDVVVNTDLEWSAVNSADTYELQVDDNSDFSSPVQDLAGLSGTTESASGLSNETTYHWRVRAVGSGGSGDWSTTWSFTTAAEVAPDPPALTAPENEAVDQPLTVLLDWSEVSGADTYRVQLADNNAFTDRLINAGGLEVTSTEATDLDHGTEYFWRVRAFGSGGPSDWSETRTFTTGSVPAPDAPDLIFPSDDAADVSLSAELDWMGVDDASTYESQVDDDPAFESPEFAATDLTATSVELSGLENASTYHWRVRAAGPGGTGPWSVVRVFTTASEPVPGAPELLSPADAAENTDLSISLDWSQVPLGTSYDIQLDDDADFSSPVVFETNLTETTLDAGDLDWLTTYHWRVRATGDGGTGAWSAAHSFTTRQMPAPGAPVLVLPADGEEGVSVSASIDWESADRADTYDLQIHSDPSFTDPYRHYEDLEVTAKIATGLEATTEYFWRVRGRGPGGAGPWSEVRSFTTEQYADFAPPEAVSPDHAMPGIPKQATIQWTAVNEAQLYHLQVDDDATFISPEFENNSLTVTSTVTSDLDASTFYYWRVRGSGIEGNGPWSEVRGFLTQPDPPELLTPTPDSVDVSTNAVFTWAASPGADRYYFQLDDDSDFGSPRLDLQGPSMLHALASGLESNTEYFWRVRASKNTGMGEWSPVQAFTTGLIQAPMTPVITTPADGAEDVSTTVLLEWTQPAGTQGYRWQLDDDPEFGSPIITIENHQSNSAAIPGLAYFKTYYWRVQAFNEGGSSFWSPTASFRTIQITPPAAPSTTAPFPGQQDVAARPTLTWTASARSSAYEVQVDDTFGFTSPEFHSDNVSGNGVSVSGLRSETFYYWRVRGLNEGGVSPWSAVGFFTTEFVPVPSTPALVHPSNDAVGFTASVALNWSTTEGAYGYHLQVDDDPQFASPVMDDEQVLVESIEVTGLSPNTRYNWRVRASSPGGFSIWSDVRTFRTAPGAPDLVIPVHGASDVRIDQLFVWDASAGASAYRVQVSADQSFATALVDHEGTDRSFDIGELVLGDNTDYWWRVRALSETGQSDWSEPFRFTTGLFMTTDTERDELLPESVRLDPAYPNPFSRTTTFEIHLPRSSRVIMKVYDMLGREVAHLAGGTLSAGNHRMEWTPSSLASGVYVAMLNVEGQSRTRLVTLAR